jgi:hypothetical protein
MAERGLDTANVRLLKTMTKRAGSVPAGPAEARRGIPAAGAWAIYVVGTCPYT